MMAAFCKILLMTVAACFLCSSSAEFASKQYDYELFTRTIDGSDPRLATEALQCVEEVIADDLKFLVEEFAEKKLQWVGKGGRVKIANHTAPDRQVILTISPDGKRKWFLWEDGWGSGYTFNGGGAGQAGSTESTNAGRTSTTTEQPPSTNGESATTGPTENTSTSNTGIGGGGYVGFGGWALRGRRIEELNDGDADDQSRDLAKRNKRKRNNRRLWQAGIQIGTGCGEFCPSDDRDEGRRVMSTTGRELELSGFEVWMNTELTERVKNRCKEAKNKVAATNFKKITT